MPFDPCVLPVRLPADQVPQLGHPILDRYLLFVAARCRPNTILATVCDLRAFFAVVAKEPHEVVVADVLDFIHEQRQRTATAGWCGWPTAKQNCPPARSSEGCRRCPGCSPGW